MLEVSAEKVLGTLPLAIEFAAAGPVTALFGPSGAGKTSILNMIAGLVTPERGRIVAHGSCLFDAERGIDVPVHLRRIGYVFQDGRLLPHLSVQQNLHYGRRMQRLGRDTAFEARILDMLDIGHLTARRTGALSGGERQRVAIGRALLARPKLLLLDEPLSGVDQSRKDEILPYLGRLKHDAQLPMLYVSHQRDEIDQLADDVVEIARGRRV